jgi:hypothetical protein
MMRDDLPASLGITSEHADAGRPLLLAGVVLTPGLVR